MDDAMYDMQTGSQDDGAGHEPVKRKPVRPAELRLDDSKENLGLERVDYGYLSPYLETQETPADRVARRLITTPSMHSHRDNPQWWSLPVGHIGRIKAQKTAARWARARTLDGRTVKFSAVAFPIRDSDKNLWGVACFASMFVRQVRQCFSAVWADGFPRCRHRFPVM